MLISQERRNPVSALIYRLKKKGTPGKPTAEALHLMHSVVRAARYTTMENRRAATGATEEETRRW